MSYTVRGLEETPFRPVPGRVHPKEGSFLHRRGKAIKDTDGRVVGRKGEHIRKQRHTVAGLRDKMATTSSSAKREVFVKANRGLDKQLDNPTEDFTPRPKSRRGMGDGRGGFLRRLAH